MGSSAKRAAAFLAAVFISAALSACGEQNEAETGEVRLQLANNLSADSVTTRALEWFAEAVEERTEGRVRVEVHNDSSLGDTKSVLELLQDGGIELVKADVTFMSEYIPAYGVLAMPYLYDDEEHFWKVHEGEIGRGLLHGGEMEALGMYGLTYYSGGARCFYNSRRPISDPRDMEEMRIRVPESGLMAAMAKALGAEPVEIAYSDVYRALQTGAADGAENSIVNYCSMKHWEVAPYFVEDAHTRAADILVMSTAARGRLKESDLAVLDQAAQESGDYQRRLWAEAEEEARGMLAGRAVTITRPSEGQLERFRASCQELWYSYGDGAYIDLLDQIAAEGK